jgi:hypothetical protein
MRLQLHLTGAEEALPEEKEDGRVKAERWRRGRITAAEARAAVDALAATGASSSVGVFVCGPPRMTDELAAAVADHPLVGKERVFTEKWW